MTFQKGQSGNPKGRPPKNRQLTEILERAGNAKKVYGNGIVPKKLLAELLWQAAATGMVTFPDQTEAVVLETEEWIGIVKFLYQHIDGPPKQTVEVGGPEGGPIPHKVDHGIDGSTATTIFDILASVGAIPTGADDAQDDGIHTPRADA